MQGRMASVVNDDPSSPRVFAPRAHRASTGVRSIADELDELRLDIETLRVLIDATLDRRATTNGSDILLRACSTVLRERLDRVAALEGTDPRLGDRRDRISMDADGA